MRARYASGSAVQVVAEWVIETYPETERNETEDQMGIGDHDQSVVPRRRAVATAMAGVMAIALLLGPVASTAVASTEVGVSPRATASALYKAWRSKDRTAARKVATAPTITKLFARSSTGPAWTFVKCVEADEPDPHFECTYRYRGGRAVLDVADSDAFGLIVNGIRFVKA